MNFPSPMLNWKTRLYFKSINVIEKALLRVRSCLNGFWLGILDAKEIASVDEYYYARQAMYKDPTYNRSGLLPWEEQMLSRYFAKARYLVVAAAGGGREVRALSSLGYKVDGFECYPEFVNEANRLLEEDGFAARVELVPPSECPCWTRAYDGAVVGWGAYMLIPGREKRIAFLRQLRSLVTDGAPVLLSFFAAEDNNRHLQRVARIANIFRRILRRPLVEVGDDLVPNLVHYCSEESLTAELKSAGFELAFYNVTDYGHAVAHSVRVAGEKPTVPSNRAPVTAAAPKLNR